MAKVLAKKAAGKMSSSVGYVNDAVNKIRSKSWAEPTGIALGATASICESLNWIPGLSIVGGALKMGSSLLNPAPTIHDLRRQVEELEKHMNSSSGILKDVLEKNIMEIRLEMEKPHSEILENFAVIKDEVQSAAKIISKDMEKIEHDLSDIKTIIHHTYRLVTDNRYRDGIEKVDAAFHNFIEGSNNLSDTFMLLENFMFELQTIAIQSLNPERISAYLRAIKEVDEKEICEQMFQYVILVRSKYLQLSCAYYIYKSDSARVTKEFENFNNHFHELLGIYEDVVGQKFEPGKIPSAKLIKSCLDAELLMPDVTQSLKGKPTNDPMKSFLENIGLLSLYDMFHNEDITMELLGTFTDVDLSSVGVSTYGNRQKILRAVADLGNQGKLLVNFLMPYHYPPISDPLWHILHLIFYTYIFTRDWRRKQNI